MTQTTTFVPFSTRVAGSLITSVKRHQTTNMITYRKAGVEISTTRFRETSYASPAIASARKM